jgi:hypothetical protein
VFYLVLILLLTFLVLTGILWAITALIQGMLYENVEPDLLWRAPAAAGAVTAFLAVWAVLNYVAAEPGQTDLPYDTLFNFTTEKVTERPVSEFEVQRKNGKMKYTLVYIPGSPKVEYRNAEGKVWLARREADVEALLVKDGDREVRFNPRYNTDKPQPGKERYVERFVEEGGRSYLDGESFGRITTPRGGGSFVRVLLNVLHFGVWFACLWLLLRFQWPHALGLAAAAWLVMTFVAPYILRVGPEAKTPPPAKVAPAT